MPSTCSTPRSFCSIMMRWRSTTLSGTSVSRIRTPCWGSGSALLSIFPFPVTGNSLICMNSSGIIYTGNLDRRKLRRPSRVISTP